jgi:isopenicillin-N epimerase
MKEHWLLDPAVAYLNHGSFGATPIAVLAKQDEFRARMERQPVQFLVRELESLLDDARATLGAFVGADPEGIAFVPNATVGVNSVIRSLDLDQHDEILLSTHEYNASRNIAEFAAQLEGARVVAAEVPFPIGSPDDAIAAVLEKVTSRTRLLLIDHITSQTGLVMPVEKLVAEMSARGIDTLIDGAHGPGMLPLDIRSIGAAYYTANLHKWVCAPKGAAFLYVRENRRASIRPIVISHGANSPRTDRSRFHLEFDWTGTVDPSPWLCVPESLQFMESLVEGGWPEIMRRNRALALRARDILSDALGIPPPAPDSMIGSMAAVPLPDGDPSATKPFFGDPLQDALLAQYGIEVPIVPWPAVPKRVLRASAQLYNDVSEYERLGRALTDLL